MKRGIEHYIGTAVIATGVASVATQLVIIREFLTRFQGNEFIIALIFFVWLVLGGIGTWAAHLTGPRFLAPGRNRLAPTPISTLTNCRNIAIKEGIHYVYVGNVPGHAGNNTYCHHCGRLLIERQGYLITAYNLKESRCRFCRTKIPGVWPTDAVD